MDAQQRAALIVHDSATCPNELAGRECRTCTRALQQLAAHVETAQSTGRFAVELLVRDERKMEQHVDALRVVVKAQARRLEALRTELAKVQRLRVAVGRLYTAAHWTADRPVDEAALWLAVRDAAELPPGTATVAGVARRRGTCDCGGCDLTEWLANWFDVYVDDSGMAHGLRACVARAPRVG